MMTGEDSLLLELRAKNGHLLRAILEREPSIAAFCRRYDLPYPTVCNYINLRGSPYLVREEGLRKTAIRIVEATGEHMIWLFDPDLYDNNLIPNETLIAEVSPRQMVGLEEAADVPALGPAPDEAMHAGELEALIDRTISTLTPREEDIIRRRFARDPYDQPQTIAAIADEYDVTEERVRQIEGMAIRKLRAPIRSRALKRALQGDVATPEQATIDRTDELLEGAGVLARTKRKQQRFDKAAKKGFDAAAKKGFDAAVKKRFDALDRRFREADWRERIAAFDDAPPEPELEIDAEVRELGIDETPEDRYMQECEQAFEDWQPGSLATMSIDNFKRHYRPATEITSESGIMTKRQLLDELTRRRVCREAGIDPELPPAEIDAEMRKRATAEARKQKEKT